MCLLINKPAGVEFTEEHLADFYIRNRDGVGIMYAEDGYLHLNKLLPKSIEDILEFYDQHARGRACAIHYRMRTHGDIDMDNCHPYPVFGFDGQEHEMPMALMHNGVLHTGNAADKHKSDTWHYIRTYLHRLLKDDPSLAFSPEFTDLIGRHIGSNNKFVLINHLGQINVINKSSGVEFHGAWLSNEYAWSSHKYMPKKTYSGGWNGQSYYTTGGKEGTSAKKPVGAPAKSPTKAGGKGTTPTTKNSKKQLTLAPSSNGGRSIATKAEKNVCNGVSLECDHLDDILEMRSILDEWYPTNSTTNKTLEVFIEEVGPTKAYLLIELLGDKLITERTFDDVLSNRNNMRYFGGLDKQEIYTAFDRHTTH